MAMLRNAAVCLLCATWLAGGGISCRAGAVRRGSREEAAYRAEEAARTVLGEHTPLISAERGDLLLFTCRNGYALVDPADGTVMEYALSFPDREPVFRRKARDAENGQNMTK